MLFISGRFVCYTYAICLIFNLRIYDFQWNTSYLFICLMWHDVDWWPFQLNSMYLDFKHDLIFVSEKKRNLGENVQNWQRFFFYSNGKNSVRCFYYLTMDVHRLFAFMWPSIVLSRPHRHISFPQRHQSHEYNGKSVIYVLVRELYPSNMSLAHFNAFQAWR